MLPGHMIRRGATSYCLCLHHLFSFHALGPIYYRDANGALLVYDITDKDSFTKVRNWVKELRKIVGQDIKVCIAGNKSDLAKRRQVNEAEALEYARSVGATHVHTSAKTGRGVNEVFLELTKQMLKGRGGRRGSQMAAGGNKRSFVAIVDEAERDNNGGCCS